MSRKIIGVTVGTTLPKPNFKQNDPTKGDYIKNKPDFDGLKSKVEQIEVTVDKIQKNAYDDTEIRGLVSTNTANIDTLAELVGNTAVSTQIDNAIDALNLDNTYAPMYHDHEMAEVNGLSDALAGKQPVGDYATKAQAQAYADAKDSAIAEAQSAGDSAQRDIDAYKISNDAAVDAVKRTADAAVVANAKITGGTHTKITYDSKGLVTGGTSLSASDIPTIAISKVSGLQTALDEISTLVGDESVETQINNAIASKADEDHTHEIADVTGLQTALNNKEASGTANSVVSTHNTSASAHNDIRGLIDGLTTRLNTLADSDDTTLDQMSEIVAYIKSNKSLIDGITTSKVNVSDIVNNLTTNVTNKPLSAAQGVAIKGLIDTLQGELDSHTHAIADVSGLQSALDGKAASSHGTHVSYSTTAPVMDGTASVGSASTVARSDHKHPTDTSRAAQADLDALETVVAGKAPASHTHAISDVTNLQSTLDGKAASSHNHTVSQITDLTATATELNYMDGVTSNVQTQLDGKAKSSHDHTITASASDDDVVVLTGTNGTNQVTYSASHANSGVTAGTYKSVTVNAKGHVTAGSNPTTLSGYGITDAASKSDLDNLSKTVNNKANTSDLTSHTGNKSNPHGVTLDQLGVTATATELNVLDGITATVTELNYVDGVTSSIQTQLNNKQATISGAATTITDSNLTVNRALISNGSGKVAVSAVTSTELGYLDGVTSAIQSQLDAKVPTSRTINGKALSANITLSASDVGADVGGSADTALNSAKSYTDAEITAWVGNQTVSAQIETAVASKSDVGHVHDDRYYTKAQMDDIELISVSDIDAICESNVQFATRNASEVTF